MQLRAIDFARGRLVLGKHTAKPKWQTRDAASESEGAKTTPEQESRTMWKKPKTRDEAKKLVAGPAGVEFEKYPLKFAIPACFGVRPQSGKPATVNSGTASLVRIGGQLFALTCSHVLEGYRKCLAKGDCSFQLGNCELDPLSQLKGENAKLDYALIGLTEAQGKEIAKPGRPFRRDHGQAPFAAPGVGQLSATRVTVLQYDGRPLGEDFDDVDRKRQAAHASVGVHE